MEPEIKELVGQIEDLTGKLKRKKEELEKKQKNCRHEWPDMWQEKVGRDYSMMSGAVDSTCRRSTPEIVAIQFKLCVKCDKEKTRRE